MAATVADQFDSLARPFRVGKPRQLCLPVNKNGEGILDAERFLVCYAVKREKSARAHGAWACSWPTSWSGPP
jgi:hypothetical protein